MYAIISKCMHILSIGPVSHPLAVMVDLEWFLEALAVSFSRKGMTVP